ncbi:MAG: molybdate ABC transporter substrate-binding protein [Actinobacteria bacterium]|nr:molybdate ABC transporter substrate-binding protein [Actinomycetota bacterium]
MIVRRALATAALAVALGTGCGGGSDAGNAASTHEATAAATTVTVSAAASLAEPFDALALRFADTHPGVTVRINSGPSGRLAAQISAGAPADVVALASASSMETLRIANLVDEPVTFATNRLVIVTRPGNPSDVDGLDDLERVGIVALCGDSAPCGSYAHTLLDAAGVDIPRRRITVGDDATATLGAVANGDADAALVYLTDARAAGDAVSSVEFPESSTLIAEYPIAVVTRPETRRSAESTAAHSTAVREFVAFVGSTDGQAILAAHGFGPP